MNTTIPISTFHYKVEAKWEVVKVLKSDIIGLKVKKHAHRTKLFIYYTYI